VGLNSNSGSNPSDASSVWTARPRSGPALVGIVVALTALLGWFGALAIARSIDPSSTADATADWLVVSALADGIDPHSNLRELADRYKVEFWVSDEPVDRVLKHPRTPGALVLLYPLSWVTADQAYRVMLVVGFAATAVAMIALSRTFSLSWIAILLGIAYATLSGPARWSHLFGSQAPILLLCVAMFLVFMSKDDNPWTGVWLAIAGTLKMFPLVLLAVLIARRRTRGMAGAVVTLGLLNLTPLLLSHVRVASTMEALSTTVTNWLDLPANIGLSATIGRLLPVNPTLASILGALMVVGAWLFVLRRSGPLGASCAFLICIGMLALPLAWPHYILSAVPAVMLALHERVLTRWQFVGAMIAVVMTIPVRSIAFHTAGLALMAAVMAYALWTRQTQGSNPSLPTPMTKPV